MVINSKDAEMAAALDAAQLMCSAARTAPKTRGIDNIMTLIITGDDIAKLSNKMKELGSDKTGIMRDSDNILNANAVVMIGVRKATYGLNCGYCGHQTCEECIEKNGACIFATTDLGIAVGSAVSIAADLRMDNRVMYSIGRIFGQMPESGDEDAIWMGIPISVKGKNPFFDRKPIN